MKTHNITILLLSLMMSAVLAAPIRILPLGDSITQGGGKNVNEYSYRWPLFKMLKDEGVDFDFIGSMNAGLNPEVKWPDYKGGAFDLDHEGHYGWKTAKVRDTMKEWMTKWQGAPDIVLIHLGTNDQKSTDLTKDVIQAHEDMIAMLREKNPKVVVLVGQLFFSGEPALTMRSMVADMVKRVNTPESPVIAVNHFENFQPNINLPDCDTYDWAHPNEKGQEKMAKKWLEAMRPFLKAPVK